MKLEEIKREDVYRLVSLMDRCDEIMREVHWNWESVFSVDAVSIIKAALFFWNRIANELEISALNLDEMPIIEEEEIISGDSDSEGVVDFIFSGGRYIDIPSKLLEELGVNVDYTELTPGMLADAVDEVMETSGLEGETAENAGRAFLKENQLKQISRCFPESVDEIIDFVEDNGCYAEGITCYSSKRIGKLYESMEMLINRLPERLLEFIVKLITAIFDPLYLRYPKLKLEGTNSEGEYCCVFSTGFIDQTGEEIHEAHMRPYLNVAAALLHRLLTEAENLAPEILLNEVNSESK